MGKGLRFQTYFGVSIPPFKEEKLGAGSTTIRFVVTGKIPSKKNSQQSVAVRKEARDYLNELKKTKKTLTFEEAHHAVGLCYSKMRANQEYLDFIERVKPIIHEQSAAWVKRLGKKGLIFPLSKAALSLRFYFNNRYVTDTVNKQQTIQDMLIECGIIYDDDYSSLNPVYSASACYVEELVHSIAFISLSFKLKKP